MISLLKGLNALNEIPIQCLEYNNYIITTNMIGTLELILQGKLLFFFKRAGGSILLLYQSPIPPDL